MSNPPNTNNVGDSSTNDTKDKTLNNYKSSSFGVRLVQITNPNTKNL